MIRLAPLRIRLRLASLRRNYEYETSNGDVHEVTTGTGGKWINNQVISHGLKVAKPAKVINATKAGKAIDPLTGVRDLAVRATITQQQEQIAALRSQLTQTKVP